MISYTKLTVDLSNNVIYMLKSRGESSEPYNPPHSAISLHKTILTPQSLQPIPKGLGKVHYSHPDHEKGHPKVD